MTANPRHHLLIGGPGRAGTSFLVQLLAACGLQTKLANGEAPEWYPDAQAGLEDLPLRAFAPHLPYVVKTPLLHLMLDEVLRDGGPIIDAVLIPLRDLAEAAASRVATERQQMHRQAPWMADLDETWEVWAHTPGGLVFSLNPLDQARLLAVGLYTLVERFSRTDVPLVFLSFPRIVTDPEYCLARLAPILPETLTPAAFHAAHAATANQAAIRLSSPTSPAAPVRHQPPDALDAIALKREIIKLRAQLADARNSKTELKKPALFRRLGQRWNLGRFRHRA